MEKLGFTENKDTNKEILLQVDERNFIKSCNLNTYFQRICGENDYRIFKQRLQLYFSDTIKLKPENLTWKEFYVKVIRAVSELEEKFDFKYTSGSPFKQLSIFQQSININTQKIDYWLLLLKGVNNDEVDIVRTALKYAPPTQWNVYVSALDGYLDVLKLLLQSYPKKPVALIHDLKEDYRFPHHIKIILKLYDELRNKFERFLKIKVIFNFYSISVVINILFYI